MANQQFAFAVHILTMLAYSGKVVDSRTVAASVKTNPVVVRRLLLALRRAGLIKTCSGKHGGAMLARNPNRISLLDIYDAVSPRPVIAIGQQGLFRKCPVSCNIRSIMGNVSAGADRAVRSHLRGIKLQQVVRKIR